MQQLSAEREPITSHIEGLENHISIMYEELVDEFDFKKSATNVLEVSYSAGITIKTMINIMIKIMIKTVTKTRYCYYYHITLAL